MPSITEQFPIEAPWSESTQHVLEKLQVSSRQGLSREQVENRLKRFGPNQLQEAKKKSAIGILVNQFESLIILLLAVAAGVSFFLREWVDGIAISVAILVNTLIGFATELRAVRSMEALQELSTETAKVRRDGSIQNASAKQLVPGDIFVFEGGDMVPADVRIVEASNLQADESVLTGESIPADKQAEALAADISLAERSNMLFKGTAITRGSGEGVVVATAMNTELGKIAAMVEQAEEETTPLEKRLDRLGRKLIYVILVIVTVVGALGVLTGNPLRLMLEMAIALAVAAIPEGLPVVATIALARGMWRMAQRNALVNRLSAVETLGATNIICTDKTGTLTENHMTVTRVVLPEGDVHIKENGDPGKLFELDGKPLEQSVRQKLREILLTGVLCNNATYESIHYRQPTNALGDPLEIALLEAGSKMELQREHLLEEWPEEREEAFRSEVMMMATFHRNSQTGAYRVVVKGAPDAVLKACTRINNKTKGALLSDQEGEEWWQHNQRLAEEGLRVLALAAKTTDNVEVYPYSELTLLGLIGLWDPPRKEVRESIAACHEAGIRVIMVTGDQPLTAKKVGLAVGLVQDGEAEVLAGNALRDPQQLPERERERLLRVPIFSRISPKQKLDIIKLHQSNNSIVAMTGDGVNDAPALKKADIGIAMGKRGTQVARESADMILQDDEFSTIVSAVRWGRVIFGNIRRFVIYLLSGNVSEVIIVSVALLVNSPLPLLPLQILYLNMLSDVFPALALGIGKGERNVMHRNPRDPQEPVLTRAHWIGITAYSVLIAVSVLVAFALAYTWLGMDTRHAVTVSFLSIAFGRLWHVFNMRDRGSKFISNDIVLNPFVWGALALCGGLLLIAVYIPMLASVLKLVHPGWQGWVLILTSSLIPWIVGQIFKNIPIPFLKQSVEHDQDSG